MTVRNKIKILLGLLFIMAVFFPVFKIQAATEFITTIKQSGGNFSTLSSWESTLSTANLDLTLATTKVFSHAGITGSISASSTVTGLTSGATGGAVYTTNSQILIKNIIGTFQAGEQVRVDGSNYVTISDAGDSAIATAQIDGAWTSADTTATTIDGWTTSATNYIKIYTTASARHNGKWDTGKYRLEITAATNSIIAIYEDYVRVEGLQLSANRSTSGYLIGLNFKNLGAGATFYVSNNIIRNIGVNNNYTNGDAIQLGWVTGSSPYTAYIWNNIFYSDTVDVWNGIRLDDSSWTAYLYNNTAYKLYYCFRVASGVATAFNLLAQSCTDGFNGTFNSSSSNNASGISSDAPGSNPQTGSVSFVDSSNYDFHLSSGDTIALNNGVSDPGAGLFSTDIDGETRSSSWDIGADEYVATATASALHGGDRNPPQITGVSVKEITKDSAVISWFTDEYAHSEVNYGLASYSYNNTVVDWDKSLSHLVKLSNLTPGAIYHFQVRSQDKSANTATDNYDYTFTALSADSFAPQISAGFPSGILSAGVRQATLSLHTDKASTCRYSHLSNVKYSEMGNIFKSTDNLFHQAELSDLRDGYVYNYYAKCQSAEGNANESDYLISFRLAEDSAVTFQSVLSFQKETTLNIKTSPVSSLQEQIDRFQTMLEQLFSFANLINALQAQLQGMGS